MAPADVHSAKIGALIIILTVTLVSSLLPLKLRHANPRLFSLGNIFAGGVFLTSGLTHMLPEAVHELDEKMGEGKGLQMGCLLCVMGIYLTMVIEKVILPSVAGSAGANLAGHSHSHSHTPQALDVELQPLSHSKDTSGNSPSASSPNSPSQGHWLMPYVLAILLSVHSVMEGIAIGVERSVSSTLTLLLAILAHKCFAAIAISMNVIRAGQSTNAVIKTAILFSAATPLGIVIGLLVPKWTEDASFTGAALQAFSSGTFVYVALAELLLDEFNGKLDRTIKVIILLGGSVMFAMFEMSHHHHHGGHEHSHSHSH